MTICRACSSSTWRSFVTITSSADLLFRIGCSFLSTHSTGGSVLWGQVMLVWVLCTV
jgi:hypothetical protein